MRHGPFGLAPWLLLFSGLFLLFLLHTGIGGAFPLLPGDLMDAFLAGPPGREHTVSQTILWNLRLPRACAAALVGANLAAAGAGFQALFRNPLADPYVVGVSSSAAVGGVIAVLMGVWASAWGLGGFLLAFLTSLAGLGLVVAIGRSRGTLALNSLLMAGVAVGSFLWALVTLLLVSAGQDAAQVLFWLLGSFVSMDWPRVAMLALVGAVGFLVLAVQARALTIFSVGEESAAHLGVETERLKWSVLLAGSALAAAAVSAVGIVGFVGLFVPHIARRVCGPDLRRLLPACALVGACGLLIGDLAAQRLVPGREINVGIITALIGAPFLLALLRRRL